MFKTVVGSGRFRHGAFTDCLILQYLYFDLDYSLVTDERRWLGKSGYIHSCC